MYVLVFIWLAAVTVQCVRFHANGNYVATSSSDSTVRLWSVQDAQPARLMHGHRGMVTALAFSPDGKYLASAGTGEWATRKMSILLGGAVAEWLACWTQAQKGVGSNRSCDAVG